jgi:hypothetical protein
MRHDSDYCAAELKPQSTGESPDQARASIARISVRSTSRIGVCILDGEICRPVERILRHAEITQRSGRAQVARQAIERQSRILTVQCAGQSLAGVSGSG